MLVVGLNSDASVRALKGEGRPDRARRRSGPRPCCALEAVDRVVVYDEHTPREIIDALLPDVLVKGADWALDAIVGREEVEAAGGRVVRVDARARPLHHRARGADPAGRERHRPRPPPGSRPSPRDARLDALRRALERRAGGRGLTAWPGPRACSCPSCSPAAPLLVVVPREKRRRAGGRGPAHAGRGGRARRARCCPSPRPGPPPFRGLPRHADAAPAPRRRPARRARAAACAPWSPRPRACCARRCTPRLFETRVVTLARGRRDDARDPARGPRRGRLPPRGPGHRPGPGGAPRRHPRRLPARPRRARAHRVPGRHRREPAQLRSRDPAHDGRARPASRSCPSPTSLPRAPCSTRCGAALPRALRRPPRPGRAPGEARARRAGGRTSLADLLPLVPGATVAPWTVLDSWAVVVLEPEAVARGGRGLPRARARGARRAGPRPLALEPEEALVPADGAARAPRATGPSLHVREVDPDGRGTHLPSRPGAPLRGRPARAWSSDLAARRGHDRPLPRHPRPRRAPARRPARGRPRGGRGDGRRRSAWARSARGFELPDAGLTVLADGDVFPEEVHLHPRPRQPRAQLPLRLPRPEDRRPRRPPGPRHRPLRGAGDARGRRGCAASSWSSPTRAATS